MRLHLPGKVEGTRGEEERTKRDERRRRQRKEAEESGLHAEEARDRDCRDSGVNKRGIGIYGNTSCHPFANAPITGRRK